MVLFARRAGEQERRNTFGRYYANLRRKKATAEEGAENAEEAGEAAGTSEVK